MKKTSGKKLNAKAKQRKLAFRGFLLDNETTQSAIAKELGVSSTAIRKSIERGAFQKGPFAEWWKNNIIGDGIACNELNERGCGDAIARNERNEKDANAGCYPAQQTKNNEVVA